MSNQDDDAEYLEMIEEYEKYKKEYGGTILRDKVNEEWRLPKWNTHLWNRQRA